MRKVKYFLTRYLLASGSKEKYSFESKIKGKQSEIRRNEAI